MAMIEPNKINVPKDVNKMMTEHELLGKTAVLVSVNNVLVCMIAIADELKELVFKLFSVYNPLIQSNT